MSKEKRQRVKFTGKRTGLEAITIQGLGIVGVGDVIEVSESEAARWTAEQPMRDGKTGSDFVEVGGVYAADENETASRRIMSKSKNAPDPDDFLPSDVNTESAHESDKDTGTVEEQAEEIRVEVPAEADEPDSKKDKKDK